MIGEYQYEPNEKGVCAITGLICPFGYKLNTEGSACELKNQICEKGYELNDLKTACVPAPTFYIPFPVLIILIMICVVPIISKVLFRKET